MQCPKCRQQRFFLTQSNADILKCRNCSHSEAFYEPSYESYHDQKYSYKRLRTVNNDPLLKLVNKCFLDMKPTSTVLDYGCGAGDYAIHFSGISSSVTGLDRSVTQAKKNSSSVHWVAHTKTKLPFASDTFDYVIAVNVIEHMHDFEGTLKELKRVLRNNGMLFITTYDTNFVLHKILYDPTHLYEWSENEFTVFVQKHLKVKQALKYGSFFNYYPVNFVLKELLRPELCVLATKN